MPRNERSRPESSHPDDLSPFELCDGCPACDLFARESILALEVDMERLSLELWAEGWTPTELFDEVRRATGLAGVTDLLAQLFIVDDSCRSEQARPVVWTEEIDRLRAQTGVSDIGVGWLARWIAGNAHEQQASRCLAALLKALFGLAGSRAAA